MALNTFNTKSFVADSYNQDAVVYIGPAKTLTMKDDLRLARTKPKPSAVYSGNARTEAKLSRTVVLTDALTPTGDEIMTVSTQLPAGIADAAIDTLCADMGALIVSTDFKNSLKQLKIAF